MNPPDESLYSDIQTCGTEEPEEDDGDDDNDENPSFSKKMLAVSEDRPKSMPLGDGGENNRPPSAQTQWRQIVDRTEQPLFGILSRARVDCLTHNSAEITIPDAYRGMVTNDHIQIINHILAECISPSCRLSVRYSDIGNEADTLAARKAKAEFEAQQAAFDETKNHPMMQTIIKAFHIDPEKVRFTFNNNRTTK